jgi:NAD kinase
VAGPTPRVVIVSRATEYAELIAHHGTREQARFFLETRGRSIEELEAVDQQTRAAIDTVSAAIPAEWPRSHVDRSDLDRFLFRPDDIVVAFSNGLVANVAKYLKGQLVVGINPDPNRSEAILVPHPPVAIGRLLTRASRAEGEIEDRTMVEAVLDDGQRLVALNEVFIGHASHQSARYMLEWADHRERQSSSGLIVTTGTGATGWGRSIHLCHRSELVMPRPAEPALAFFVREAWPSPTSGASLTEGRVEASDQLLVTSQMNERGVIFGDGIEADHLAFNWGQTAAVRIAPDRLRLLR